MNTDLVAFQVINGLEKENKRLKAKIKKLKELPKKMFEKCVVIKLCYRNGERRCFLLSSKRKAVNFLVKIGFESFPSESMFLPDKQLRWFKNCGDAEGLYVYILLLSKIEDFQKYEMEASNTKA